MLKRCLSGLFAPTIVLLAYSACNAQSQPDFTAAMRWRMIGPFRGGRTVAICGVPGRPGVFYMAPNNGGVWKSTDYGRVWKSIFDEQPTGSIGAIAVAPPLKGGMADGGFGPDVIYVGSGEGLQRPDLSVGDGMYRSTDDGKTWKHLGLRDGQQIAAIAVDPRDSSRLFVAVLGHPYGPNAERGVYRSTNAGETFQRVLYTDENTGATEVVFDPRDPETLYAVLWSGRQAPWEIGSSWDGPGSGLFKSRDGGRTWQRKFPAGGQGDSGAGGQVGRIGISVAPSMPSRIYALVDSPGGGGLMRSDDAGETWRSMNREGRIWGRGSDFAEVRSDPRNPDIVYVANTSTYRSVDGGATFTAIKGAPGGDDYHRIWISPEDPRIIALGSDQGATISVNGGETWSSWYNQPTAQFYHVATDNRFPYWVYGAQQESGSIGIASRGDYGAITWRDWMTIGVEEYGYVAPDPLNPDIIYGGKLTRFDRRTGDVQDVSPELIRSGKLRYVRTLPVVFSPVDKHALYFGANVVFKTRDGGKSWAQISPDLTRTSYETPPNVGIFKPLDTEQGKHRGVVYTIAPSPLDADLLWAGTDDGLIWVTRDGGKSWKNVTPPAMTPWSKVSMLEAGHFDRGVAYAAINRIRLDDLRPHIYRTRDGGATWVEIVGGLPADAVVNAVREDVPRHLFAATEKAVYYSIDDGASWRSLLLNMPVTSIRDLVIHGDDLVIGTHGRSFWILDNITPLRQGLLAALPALPPFPGHLFQPQVATEVRRSRNTDTPIPPEEPMGQNPPDGAIIDYWLKEPVAEVAVEVLDTSGKLVRRYSSKDKLAEVDPRELAIPTYWIRPPSVLPATAGAHRFVWDLRYTPPDVPGGGYPISAIPHDTPREPLGPFVAPGWYKVILIADGRQQEARLCVLPDPRLQVPTDARARRQALIMRVYEGVQRSAAAVRAIQARRAALQAQTPTPAIEAELGELSALVPAGGGGGGRRRQAAAGAPTLVSVRDTLAGLLGLLDGSDNEPTTQATAACNAELAKQADLMKRWEKLRR